MSVEDDPAVLVVGAGPTGLTLACCLARCGVRVRVIDQAPGPSTAARATAYVPRSLEIFDDLGVITEALRGPWTDASMRFYVDGRPVDRSGASAPCPTEEVPYPQPARPLPTWRVEAILRERLADFGVTVEFGRRLVGLEQDGDRVTVTVEISDGERNAWGHAVAAANGEADSPATGVETVTARFVVGCDGGHSACRRLAGIELQHGEAADYVGFLAELQIDGLEPAFARTYANSDGRSLHLNPIPLSKNFQLNGEVHADADGGYPEPTLDLAQRMLDEIVGLPGLRVRDLTWASLWRVRETLADHYRRGRVFIAGDAAHMASPLGGQGANMGVGDGYNLGWKLAYVLQGWSPPALLDSYEFERRPIALRWVRTTSERHRRVFASGSGPPTSQRLCVPRQTYLEMSQLGHRYPDSPINGGDPASDGPTTGDRAPDGRVVDAPTGDRLRLFDIFRGSHFTLLLFGAHLTAVAGEVDARYRGKVRPHVLKGVDDSCQGWAGSRLIDPEGRVAASYHADERPLVLVRPDGYIAFHGGQADADLLLSHVDGLLP